MPLTVVLLPFVLIVATDAWVYVDDRTQCERGTPVVFSIGQFRIDRPVDWVAACTFLWVVFFPLYLVGRRS